MRELVPDDNPDPAERVRLDAVAAELQEVTTAVELAEEVLVPAGLVFSALLEAAVAVLAEPVDLERGRVAVE